MAIFIYLSDYSFHSGNIICGFVAADSRGSQVVEGVFHTRRLLTQDSLVFALGTVVAVEAAANTGGVVAQTAARAVAAGLVTITLEHIGSGGALDCKSKREMAGT